MRYLAARQSVLIALVLALLLAGWMASGLIAASTEKPPAASQLPAPRDDRVRVRVRTSTAEAIDREIVLSGRTEPARSVTLRAEIDGRVVEVAAARGAAVRAGDAIVRLDPRDREAQLREARARLRQRELEHEAARKLSADNFQSRTQLAQASAQLEAARARLRAIELDLANTVVRAPFDGVLEERAVELGDYVPEGAEVARVIERHPLLVTGYVSQQEIHLVRPGMRGRARLVSGQEVEGTVRYVASESAPATRTFRIELEVPNPRGELVLGVTSEIRIAVERHRAHHLSPALLALDEADTIGVKTVNEDDTVEFHPVNVVRSAADGVWVTGLPETVRVITVGQGFVHPGDRVMAEEVLAETSG